MAADLSGEAVSKKLFWTGWVLSVLPALLLVFSGVMKLIGPEGMAEEFEHLGWPPDARIALGIVELVSAALYLIPHTAVLGAVLLTGYLGGAVATHARIEEPFWIPIVIGVVVWLGLVLRDARLRMLLPLRRS